MEKYFQKRKAHWDAVAEKFEHWRGWGDYYHRRIEKVYQFNIPTSQRILEVGCGNGDLLESLNPAYGLGIDISEKMVERAKLRHPNLRFEREDACSLESNKIFDFVIISDTINDLWDVQKCFENIRTMMDEDGRLMINFYNRFWEIPIKIAEKIGVAKPTLPQNWLTIDDTSNLLDLAGFDVIKSWEEIIFPFFIPLLTPFFNRILARLWPFKLFAMTHFIVCRPKPSPKAYRRNSSVSIIIPARNEAGNISVFFDRIPSEFKDPEIIFVEGHSSDNTLEEIQTQIKNHPNVDAKFFVQTGKGKGDAVRLGFSEAKGDILMILDADLTMPPENLPRFYHALNTGTGDFINGVRLVYPMEKHAMRFFNLIGNKFFSIVFSFLLGQPIKDTLCGTKVLWKKDYQKIAENRDYFGDFDPFGDFDLIFGAAKLNLKIVDMPIRYAERVYGETNIQRWKHGWLLLKMVSFAARRVKFI